jgi:hypothetical protein
LIPNGRVFFCQHFTPELVWRDEWRRHENGVTDIVGFAIAASDPDKTAALYRSIFGSRAVMRISGGFSLQAGKATVSILTPDEVAQVFTDAAPVSEDISDRMVALTLKTHSVAVVEALLAAAGISYSREEDRILVPHWEAEGVALAFVE